MRCTRAAPGAWRPNADVMNCVPPVHNLPAPVLVPLREILFINNLIFQPNVPSPRVACGWALPRLGRTRFGAAALVGQDHDKAEADAAVPAGRVEVVPVGRGAAVGIVAPAAAA